MLHQNIASNLVVDLTTTEQEILTGGCHKSLTSEENREPGTPAVPPQPGTPEPEPKDDGGKRYNFLIYRPFLYRPNYFVTT